MEDIVIAGIMIFLLVFVVTTLAADVLSAHAALVANTQLLARVAVDRQHTFLEWVQGSTDSNNVWVVLRNRGGHKLAGYSHWDVVLRYYTNGGSYYVKWLPYRDGAPTVDEWTVEGIYLDASASAQEYYDAGILNPGEYIRIWIAVQPPPGANAPKLFALCTNVGSCIEATFAQ